MARLSNEDLQAILGPDYARRMQAEMERKEGATPEERAAELMREANRLSDVVYTMVAVIIGGVALMGGSFFNKTGIDVQAQVGLAALAFGAIGVFYLTSKRKKLLALAVA